MKPPKKKILIVIGTRPNFIKVTRFKSVATGFPSLEVKIVHTGQHYDNRMARVFFDAFGLIPDFLLDLEPGSAASQAGEMIKGLAAVMEQYRPDLVMVVGDVNSTLCGAIAANKLGIRLAHLESGLRSFDRTMPEELNRIITDELADIFFVTEQSGCDNLLNERRDPCSIFLVGNTMIDTLLAFRDRIETSQVMEELGLEKNNFVLITIHRPATVDTPGGLQQLAELIGTISARDRVVFPIHPRTLKRLSEFGLIGAFRGNPRLVLCDPLDYFSFQKLVASCKLVITDSGGIQEETTFLGVPCLTLRKNTERPITITSGTNELIPFDPEIIVQKTGLIASGRYKKGKVPDLWDGRSTEAVVKK